MARSKSSSAWLKRHVNDPYVHRARAQGYRSRAAFKLIEIAKRDRLARPGDDVVDLGAAPGGWAQVLAERVGQSGRVIAVDLLEIAPIPGVTIVRGDFREETVLRRLEEVLGSQKLDLVVSDMAPNLSGIESSDSARIAHLVELAVEFSQNHLTPRGALVCKVFHGSGYSELVKLFKERFKTVKTMKPKASRDKSAETFLVGIGLKMTKGSADIVT